MRVNGEEEDVRSGQRQGWRWGEAWGESIFVESFQELKSRLEDFLSSCPPISGCMVRRVEVSEPQSQEHSSGQQFIWGSGGQACLGS